MSGYRQRYALLDSCVDTLGRWRCHDTFQIPKNAAAPLGVAKFEESASRNSLWKHTDRSSQEVDTPSCLEVDAVNDLRFRPNPGLSFAYFNHPFQTGNLKGLQERDLGIVNGHQTSNMVRGSILRETIRNLVSGCQAGLDSHCDHQGGGKAVFQPDDPLFGAVARNDAAAQY